jgi:hypothetical protein
VPDDEPLHVRAHAEVGSDADVEAGRRVAGAGDDGEEADVGGIEARVVERGGDRLLAQRQRVVRVAAHPHPRRPGGRVLDGRVDGRVAAPHARPEEDPLGDPVAGEVLGEGVLPHVGLLDAAAGHRRAEACDVRR